MKKNGAIIADTVYIGNKLVARDVAITLPEITFKLSTFQAMGDLELPMPSTDAMEASITHIGIDLGLRNMLKLEPQTLECRYVQQEVSDDGTNRNVGCKSFLRVIPKTIPSLSLNPGEASENELTFATTRYQSFYDGTELWLVDKLSNILRISGTDYAKKIEKLL